MGVTSLHCNNLWELHQPTAAREEGGESAGRGKEERKPGLEQKAESNIIACSQGKPLNIALLHFLHPDTLPPVQWDH